MENVTTMNLSVSDDSGMVPLSQPGPVFPPPPPPAENKQEEKNISNNNKETMDSATPIDEVMGLNDMSNAPIAQDPRMAPQMSTGQAQQLPVAPAQQPAAATPQQASKNPLNLTDEQMEALIVGVVAVVAFSKPVQEKLAQMIPQFMNENGSRSTVGMVLSGLVAALVYFFTQRFVLKR